MKRYLLATALLSTSCGPMLACKTEIVSHRRVDDDCTMEQLVYQFHGQLRPMLEAFSNDALKRSVPCYKTRKVVVEKDFPKELEGNVIGYCQAPWTVSFKKSYWDTASAADRMTLVYHELGHCALGLEHYDEGQDIMNTYLLPGDIADQKWDRLVNNMFKRAKQ